MINKCKLVVVTLLVGVCTVDHNISLGVLPTVRTLKCLFIPLLSLFMFKRGVNGHGVRTVILIIINIILFFV